MNYNKIMIAGNRRSLVENYSYSQKEKQPKFSTDLCLEARGIESGTQIQHMEVRHLRITTDKI